MFFDRMRQRVPSALAVGCAVLSGYVLAWHKVGSDGSGKCDITESGNPADTVWGVVYSIDPKEKSQLDSCEGVPTDYTDTTVTVMLNGEPVEAYTYCAKKIDRALKPYHWYKACVLAGALQNGLPSEYITDLLSQSVVIDSDKKRSQQGALAAEQILSQLEIRPFHDRDEETVIQLWHECGLVVPSNDPHKDIRRKCAFQSELFLVGELGGKVIATVMAGYEGHRGWINYLTVTPGCRHAGIGARLMCEAECLLLALGCPKINLQIRSRNTAVAAFYEKIGFMLEETVSMGKRLINDE